METGIGIAGGLVQRSVSAGTWAAYSSVWREWDELVSSVGGCVSEQDRLSLLLYVIGMQFSKGESVSKMNRRLAALAFLYKLQGLRDITKEFMVRQAMKGFRRGRVVRDTRRPVSFGLLQDMVGILPRVCSSPYEVQLFTAAFSLAFFGALRIGELVSKNKRGVGGLLFSEVQINTDSVQLLISRSKTDQLGKGVYVTLFKVLPEAVCPVRSVQRFAQVRKGVQGPFLQHEDGSSLSRFQFVAIFKRCLLTVGMPAAQFNTHSFRVGAATEAARWGLSQQMVMRIGRWESDRFKIYVRPHML